VPVFAQHAGFELGSLLLRHPLVIRLRALLAPT